MNLNSDKSENVNYNISKYPIYIRQGKLSYYPCYSAPPHWHDDVEFIYVLSGKMEYNINSQIVSVGEKQGIIVNSKRLHFGFSNDNTECDFICVLLHPDLLCANTDFQNDYVMPVINNPNLDYLILDGNISWQKNILNCLNNIFDSQVKKSYPLVVQSEFYKIWSLICDNTKFENVSSSKENRNIKIVKKMINFIHENYKIKISLADIANSGAVGQSKCCRLFSEFMGQTPISYLVRYRLEKSTFYLKNSAMNITEIANEVGFNSGSYYTETFVKYYGVTPTEYRK